MPECNSCSVEDICDECAEGYYWIDILSECRAYVNCTETEYESYTIEGE
jgi:hypothetical protein